LNSLRVTVTVTETGFVTVTQIIGASSSFEGDEPVIKDSSEKVNRSICFYCNLYEKDVNSGEGNYLRFLKKSRNLWNQFFEICVIRERKVVLQSSLFFRFLEEGVGDSFPVGQGLAGGDRMIPVIENFNLTE